VTLCSHRSSKIFYCSGIDGAGAAGGESLGAVWAELAFDLVWSVNRARLVGGAQHVVPDWLSDAVPSWLAEVMWPKALTPW
jgi:hypothetical protein